MMNNMFMAYLQQLMSNPLQFLLQRRLNVPQNIPTNDPNAILNYLVSSGQVSQEQIKRAYQYAQNLKR